MKSTSAEKIAEKEEDVRDAEAEVESLQNLIPVERQRDRLKDDEIPSLRKQIQAYDALVPSLSEAADKVRLHHPSASKSAHFNDGEFYRQPRQ